jgi:hypothetical protein
MVNLPAARTWHFGLARAGLVPDRLFGTFYLSSLTRDDPARFWEHSVPGANFAQIFGLMVEQYPAELDPACGEVSADRGSGSHRSSGHKLKSGLLPFLAHIYH